jgi:hypothetical protein
MTEAIEPIERLRRICLALPEATERLSHGHPVFFVRDNRVFVSAHPQGRAAGDDHRHDEPHVAFWCAAPPGFQRLLVGNDPVRFYVPPYVGHRGWLGVRLDTPGVDWDEIRTIVEGAYREVAPRRLVALLDDEPPALRS